MAKTARFNMLLEKSTSRALNKAAKERGISAAALLRELIDRELLALEEARLAAELKARREAPDLVIVEIGPGISMQVERAEAVKAGLQFQERK